MTLVNWLDSLGSAAVAMQNADTGTVAAPGWAGSGTEQQQPIGTSPGTGAAPQGPGSMILPLVMGMLLLMVVTTMMSSRKEKKKRTQLISSLKKNDRVQTIGGIIGSVAEVRKDEVVLRVDEGSNVRIRFAKSAISGVLSEAPGGAERTIEEKSAKQPSEVATSA